VNSHWPTVLLGEVCQTGAGGTPLKQNNEYYENGTIPWLLSGEVSQGEIHSASKFISQKGLDNSSAKIFPENTVLVAMYGATAGQVGILRFEAATNQAVCGILPGDKFSAEFLYYFFLSRKDKLVAQATGNAQPNISQVKIRNTRVPVVPLAEQQHLVDILDKAFAAIATAKANTEKNLQNARALFESELASVFISHNGDWTDSTIGEHIHFIDYRGKTPKKTDSGLRLITAKNVKMGYLQETPTEFVAPGTYKTWMTRGIPRSGDVLFTTEAPLANVAQLDTDEKVVFAQRIIIMQPDTAKLNSTFLKYLLLSGPVQERIRTQGTGATVQGIKASLLRKVEISFPTSLKTQHAITHQLDGLRLETQRLEAIYQKKLAALEALKKSLLHEAFRGQL
jgi:type I restriction enzyme S subunit